MSASEQKQWKDTVAEVGSTVADAAVDAVAVLGDAARSLTTGRAGGMAAADHAAARSQRRRQRRADARERKDAEKSAPDTTAGGPLRELRRRAGRTDRVEESEEQDRAGARPQATSGTAGTARTGANGAVIGAAAAAAGTAARPGASSGPGERATTSAPPREGDRARPDGPARKPSERSKGAGGSRTRSRTTRTRTGARSAASNGASGASTAAKAAGATPRDPAGTSANGATGTPNGASTTAPGTRNGASTTAPGDTTGTRNGASTTAPGARNGTSTTAPGDTTRRRNGASTTAPGDTTGKAPERTSGAGGAAAGASGATAAAAAPTTAPVGRAPRDGGASTGSPSTTQEMAWLPSLRRRRSKERPWLLRAVAFALASVAGIAALVVAAVALLPRAVAFAAESTEAELILPDDATFDPLAQRTKVLYADGSLLAVLTGEEDRKTVGLDKMPDHAWQAIVAAEDKKFFEHDGYDPEGIGRALFANFQAGGVEQGGSTISQQVARMNFKEVGLEQSVERKFKEVVYAVALEERFSKQEILNRYVNQVYFGAGAYGLQAASQEFFGTGVDQIRPHQAALLAGLISSPSAYNPRVNPDLAVEQRDLVLDSMGDAGYLTEAQVEKFKSRKVKVQQPSANTNKQPAIIEEVMREVKSNPIFGATVEEREDNLFTGGLRIKTTIRPNLQKLAEATVDNNFPGSGPTAAIASVDPRTGQVLAAASAKRFNKQNFNLAIRGRRQPGSAFKPFVMAEALRQGFSPSTTLNAKSPIVIRLPWEDWSVENYGGASYGQMDMAAATKSSVNTYFAQLIQLVGVEKSVKMAERLGIERIGIGEDGAYGPAIVLGGLRQGATPLEMASAYGTFANNGVHVDSYLISRVARGSTEIFKAQPRKDQILKPGVNAAALRLLQGPPGPGGTAPNVSYAMGGWPVAGKTGTTQLATDAWFVGTTPVMSTAVWVGHKSGQVRMYGATGGGTASPIWTQYMTQALSGRKVRGFPSADEAQFVGKSVNVPNVVGSSEQAALEKLAKRKLVGSVQYQASAAPAGSVLWISPSDSAQVGTTVYLGVSTGVPPPPPKPEPEPEPDNEPRVQPRVSGGNDSGGGGGNNGRGNNRGGGNNGGGNGDD